MIISVDELTFLASRVKLQIECYAREVVHLEPAAVSGFGMAREKTEGESRRYDPQMPFYFGILDRHQNVIVGPATSTKVLNMVARADRYIRKAAGFAPWDTVMWRAEPAFETERDFETNEVRTSFRFRGWFADL